MKRSIPLNDLTRHHARFKKEILRTIMELLSNSHFILGPEMASFEKNFSHYIGVKHAVGVASGTAALQLALLACGIQQGDEVITPTHSFAATAEAIISCGAKPVFVDIDKETYTINPGRIEERIAKRTKAIIPVHLYGHPCDMGRIRAICKHHNLKLIEDCAQAHGAVYKGKRVGSFGDASCFSFFPAKNLGALGDGGMVTTDTSRLARRVRMLRDHGRSSKYIHQIVGFGERLDNLQAAILDLKLKRLKQNNQKRRKWASFYNLLLKNDEYVLPVEKPWAKHVYYVYTIRHPKRDKIVRYLNENDIATGIYYPIPLHLQPSFRYLGYRRGDFPVTEKIVKEIFSIPMFPELTRNEVKRTSGILKKAVKS